MNFLNDIKVGDINAREVLEDLTDRYFLSSNYSVIANKFGESGYQKVRWERSALLKLIIRGRSGALSPRSGRNGASLEL